MMKLTQQEIKNHLASQHTMLATVREQLRTLRQHLSEADASVKTQLADQFTAVEQQIRASELENSRLEMLIDSISTEDSSNQPINISTPLQVPEVHEHDTPDHAYAALHSITEGVLVLDENQCVTFFNPAAERVLSISAQAITGQPLASIAEMGETEDDRKRARLVYSNLYNDLETADHQGIHSTVLELVDPPQTIVVKRAPVLDDDEHVRGEVIVLYDLSAETSLSQAKTDFIATISHELRTPLTLIFGNLDLLLRGYIGALNDEQSEMLKQVRKRASDINAVVSNMIMIASIQANTLTVDIQPQDLLVILESVLGPMQSDFVSRGITVTKDIPDDLPLLHTDRELLRLILTQLLDNARRYTKQGEVCITARSEDGQVRVDIADTGSGMTPEMQKRLFTRFQRVEGNISAERGAGLGLAITRQIIERLHGEIWATSTPGEGSVFSFVLPVLLENSDT